MTEDQFIEMTGYSAKEYFGLDWENYIEELSFNPDRPEEFAIDFQNGDWPWGKRRCED